MKWSEGMKAFTKALRVLQAGLVGSMLFLSVNTAANVMRTTGSEQFVSWAGANVHDQIQKRIGEGLGERRWDKVERPVSWQMLNPRQWLYWRVGPGMFLGFVLGAAVGGAVLLVERLRKSKGAAGPSCDGDAADAAACCGPGAEEGRARFILPRYWPLCVAAAAFPFHGYVLGLAAWFMAGHIRARAWLVWGTRLLAMGAVLFWGIGTEIWWGQGWGQSYPEIKNVLKWFFGAVFGGE
jgi:hypothetical protein